MDIEKIVTDLLARAKQNDVSIRSICLESGIAQSTPWRWRKKAAEPDISTLNKMSGALDEILRRRAATASGPAASH